ncbi:CDP-diacylglycerol--serine O-phosphatidyltransferase [Yoonia vestfoldensis]|uniref:CDP-diacylglycerol--serine O-phosphatidyltransferase n=1 Tax=Yoonia vestfoldensis TaxID=245188 RepID=UPI00036EFC50|nr:CDP-diacylglycerol--serine O-phosphatidyltransferase [Yoonia vestfoldensis]
MTDLKPRPDLPVIALLPNLITLAAICAGLTAIRFGIAGEYDRAVLLILLAGFLDGIDGRLARALKSESRIGAELDSLADFVNFGTAAPLLVYLFSLQDLRSAGWIAVLVFTICCVLRLARFNVESRETVPESTGNYFVGVPAPAGALLVMLPLYVSFLLSDGPVVPAPIAALWVLLIGVLMISRIPTYSFKMMTISRGNVPFFLLGAVVLLAALLTYLWATLVVMGLIYIVGIHWAWRETRQGKH